MLICYCSIRKIIQQHITSFYIKVPTLVSIILIHPPKYLILEQLTYSGQIHGDNLYKS